MERVLFRDEETLLEDLTAAVRTSEYLEIHLALKDKENPTAKRLFEIIENGSLREGETDEEEGEEGERGGGGGATEKTRDSGRGEGAEEIARLLVLLAKDSTVNKDSLYIRFTEQDWLDAAGQYL